jgi:MFS family permease
VRFLAALAVLTLLAGLPLFQFKEMSGHDSLAYLPRFVEFWQVLKHGTLVPRWAPDLGAGYGEPTFNFNPPLLYYLGSFFHALGFTFIASEDLAIFALLLTAAVGMYLFGNSIWGRHGGLVAATAYVYAPFLLVRLYVNHALADFAAFAFLPFAFWGVYYAVAKGSGTHRFMCVLAVAALMLTSISVAVIVMPALALVVAWLSWQRRSWRSLAAGVWCLGMGIGLSAFFWIPAFGETAFVHIHRREEGGLNYHLHFLHIQQLLYSAWGYGLSPNGFSFALGPAHLALLAVAAVLLRPLWRTSKSAAALLTSLLLLILVSVFFMTRASLFIWNHVGALHPLQFPWRFLSYVAFAIAFAAGAPFLFLRAEAGKRRIANWLMCGAVGAIFLLNFYHAAPQTFLTVTDADYSPLNISSKGLPATAREFEPIDVQQFPAQPASTEITVLSGAANYSLVDNAPSKRSFSIVVSQPARLRLNTFYFPGWTLYVDNVETPTSHANEQGLMDFSLPTGKHDVRLEFHDTPIRTWSTRLSLATLALLLLAPAASYTLRRFRRRADGPPGASEGAA